MNVLFNLSILASFFMLYYSLISKFITNHLYLTDSLVSTIFGILSGHRCLNLLKNTNSKMIIMMFSKSVLCLQTMAISQKISKKYLKSNFWSIFHLVGTFCVIKCIIMFIFVYLLGFLKQNDAWALAAALTPTDPILSAGITSGKFSRKNVSKKLRDLLNTESCVNDGIGVLLLYIAIDFQKNQNYAINFKNYVFETLFIKVTIPVIFCIFMGYSTHKLSKIAYKYNFVRTESLFIQSLVITFFSASMMSLIDASEVICIFFIGIQLYKNTRNGETTNLQLTSIVENTFVVTLFIFFGAIINFRKFTVEMYLTGVIVLLLRPFIIFSLYKLIPAVTTESEVIFLGLAGPVGVAALYYCLLYDMLNNTSLIDYGMCIVFISVVFYGTSIPIYLIIKKVKNAYFSNQSGIISI